MAVGKTSSAENVLSAALKTNPHDVDALLQRSQILLASRKTAEAEADLNQVLHFTSDSAVAHYLLATLEQSRGNRARQNAELNEALRCDTALVPARAALAQLMVVSGSPQTALEVLNATPRGQAHSLILMLDRNLANYASGNQQAFREGVAQTLQMARVPDTLLQDAIVKLLDRDYVRAQASVSEALKQDPDNIRGLKATALIYSAQDQPKQASTFLIAYLGQTKSAAVAQFVGQWLWSVGEHAQARAAFTRAKSLDPGYLPADLELARVDLAEGKDPGSAFRY
jgi:Tfp pilus assembly protein PilF